MARPKLGTPLFRLKCIGGRYHIRWTDPETGRTRSKTTGCRDRRDAERWLARFAVNYERDEAPDEVTVQSVLDGYARTRKGDETLKHSAKPLARFFANVMVSDLSENTIKRYARDRGRSPGTIIRELGVLRAALHWGERQRWYTSAPKFLMPVQSPPPRRKWMTRDQARALLDAATAPHIRMFILLGIFTGARKSAILGLTWDQVGEGIIDFGEGKGRKRRAKVPIAPPLRMELDAQMEVATTDYVVEFSGRAPLKSIQTGWRLTTERAGLTWVTPHVLRHTCATWQIMDGVPVAKVARFLGDTERMIEQVYGHHSPDYLQDSVAALDF